MKKQGQYCSEDGINRQLCEDGKGSELQSCLVAARIVVADADPHLFENAINAIFLCDEAGVITHVNRRAEGLLGYPRQEIVTRPCAELFSSVTEVVTASRLQHSVVTETPISWEAEIVRKDGTHVPVEVQAGLMPGDARWPRTLQVVLWDISQKKNVERQRADFLEMLAHDIRSPLSVVLGYADLLLSAARSRASHEDTDMLLSLRSGAFSLSTLVMNYLDLAKIEARPVVLARGPVPLREVLWRVGKQYEREAQRLQVLLDCAVPEDLPPVLGDATALERIVTNLLHNALKFTPAKGTVTIRAFVRQQEEIVITVTDTGSGMTLEEIAVVFEKYRTAQRDRKREGSGLGLFIVKTLVEAHGGRVEVDSTLGAGTCMSVVLPTVMNCESGKL